MHVLLNYSYTYVNIFSTQQTKRASTVKARIEGFKIAELQGKSTERSNQNAQPLKESTSSEERKAAVSNHFKLINRLTAIDTFMQIQG